MNSDSDGDSGSANSSHVGFNKLFLRSVRSILYIIAIVSVSLLCLAVAFAPILIGKISPNLWGGVFNTNLGLAIQLVWLFVVVAFFMAIVGHADQYSRDYER